MKENAAWLILLMNLIDDIYFKVQYEKVFVYVSLT